MRKEIQEKNKTMNDKISYIKLELIQESKTNQRKTWDKESLNELADSIKRYGVIQPIVVRVSDKEKYELVTGSRRVRASQIAGLSEIPAIIREMKNDEVIEVQIIENLQRQDIHPLDECIGFENLIKSQKYSIESIAEKIGKSKQYIYSRLRLSNLIPELSNKFREHKLNFSQANILARITPDDQRDLLDNVENYTEKDIKNKIEQYSINKLDDVPFNIIDKTLYPEAGACTTCKKNTGCDTQLFPELAEKQICTDSKCYLKKIGLYIDRRYKELAEKNKTLYKITDKYYSEDPEILGLDKYVNCKKNDKGAVIAILVETCNASLKNIGKTKYIKLFTNTRKSNTISLEEKINTAKDRAKIKARLDAQDLFSNKINKKYISLLDNIEILKILCRIAIRDIPFQILPKLKKYYNWNVEKDKYGRNDYNKLLENTIISRSGDSANLIEFLYDMFMWKEIGHDYDYEGINKDYFKQILSIKGIDLAGIQLAAEAEAETQVRKKFNKH